MNKVWLRPITKSLLIIILITLLSFSFFPSLFIEDSAEASSTRAPATTSELVVTEHRISVVMEDGNRNTVQDEFWVSNTGTEPYFGSIYTWLPDRFTAEDGMFCQISETGGHTCHTWLHEGNIYYWDGYYSILPKDYATDFELKVTVSSKENQSNYTELFEQINADSEVVEHLIEPDSWGWIRTGFYRGWVAFFNLTIPNNNAEDQKFQFNHSKIPAGVKFEIYLDNDNDRLVTNNDTLLGYDSDYDGFINPSPQFEVNRSNESSDIVQKGIIEFPILNTDNTTVLVYLRADYTYHFLSKYQTYSESIDDKTSILNKQTIYDTQLMRVFVVPNDDISFEPGDISFQKRQSGSDVYYYGEWQGLEGEEVDVKLIVESSSENRDEAKNNAQNDSNIFVLIIIIAIILAGAMVFRSRRAKYYAEIEAIDDERKPGEEAKKKTKRTKTTKPKTDLSQLLGKKRMLKKKIEEIKAKEFENEIERDIDIEMCSQLEIKLNNLEREIKRVKAAQTKKPEALIRLEADHKAGVIDKDIYNELKEKYREN
jgi:hypothetical protein